MSAVCGWGLMQWRKRSRKSRHEISRKISRLKRKMRQERDEKYRILSVRVHLESLPDSDPPEACFAHLRKVTRALQRQKFVLEDFSPTLGVIRGTIRKFFLKHILNIPGTNRVVAEKGS